MSIRNINYANNKARLVKWSGDNVDSLQKGPDLVSGDYLSGLNSSNSEVQIIGLNSDGYPDVQTAVPGLSPVKVSMAVFDPSADTGSRTIAAHTLGPTIPSGSILLQVEYYVVTTFTSATDAGTIALSIQSANDLVVAVAISNGGNPWDAGIHAGIPVNTAATAIRLTADRIPTATVAVEALTAGKLVLYCHYIPGL